ncbi:unnamed protein product, partial [Menidia menidia]
MPLRIILNSARLRNLRQRSKMGYVYLFLCLAASLKSVSTVTHYSVPEEMEEGSVVANLASDLGLDVRTLKTRKMRVDVVANKKYIDINKDTGELFILERIDREFLCPSKTTTSCFLKLDATIENPIRMFNIEVEILDINDNAPHFRRGTMHLDISESSPVGERFSLNNAVDPDVGTNSVKNYHLSASSRYIVSSIPRGTGLTDTSDSAASTLQPSWARYVLVLTVLTSVSNVLTSVTHYSIPEEMKEGSVVANLASDLSLDVTTLKKRKMRLDIIANKKYLDVNKDTGELYIVEKIDREQICTTKISSSCYLKLEVTLENPLRIFNIELEVLDMNDNAPQFRRDAIHLDISEATPKGERFSLSNAVDPDVGSNSVKTYHLSESEYFNIEIQTGRDGSKFAELILKKALDREQQAVHNLILSAVDGGTPARSGTASIVVHVMDTNDNAPTFDKSIYNVNIMENSPIGSLVIDLNATDLDEGSNSD